MIKNDHQYQVTKSWVEKFSQALASVRQNEDKKNLDPDGWQLLQDSYQSQLSGLLHELTEYETLITHDPHQPVVVTLDDFNKISDLLIKARLALKITQQELAALSDMPPARCANAPKNKLKPTKKKTIKLLLFLTS